MALSLLLKSDKELLLHLCKTQTIQKPNNNSDIKKFEIDEENNFYLDLKHKCFYTENKKFFSKKVTKSKVYQFSDFIKYDADVETSYKEKSNTKDIILGAAVLGLEGAIIGASNPQETEYFCDKLSIIIYVNDYYNPKIELKFIKGRTNINSFTYTNAIKNAKDLESYLILMENEKNTTNKDLKNN